MYAYDVAGQDGGTDQVIEVDGDQEAAGGQQAVDEGVLVQKP